MHHFLYGRHDPLDGLEGYEVFRRDTGIQRETLRAMSRVFSNRDPGKLPEIQPFTFLVYTPLTQDLWALGLGTLESRGGYLSYLVHGMVLNEADRKAWAYNPIPLVETLCPKTGPRRSMVLPQDPVQPITAEGCALDGLVQGPRAAGLAKFLTSDRPAGAYLAEPYQSPAFWTLVYLLLPITVRANLSLCTFAPFLEEPAHLMGTPFAPARPLPGRDDSSALGRLLHQMASATETKALQTLGDLRAAVHDLVPDLTDPFPEHFFASLEHVARGLGRISVQAAKHWLAVPAKGLLFPAKVRALATIWQRNREERPQWAAGLPLKILESIGRDWSAQSDPDPAVKKGFADLVDLLLASTPPSDFFAWLRETDDALFWSLHDRTLVGLLHLFEDELPVALLLARRLRGPRPWSRTLSRVLNHPCIFSLDGELLGRLIGALPPGLKASFTHQLLSKRFLGQPGRFSTWLSGLSSTQHAEVLLAVLWQLLGEAQPVRDLVGEIRSMWPESLVNHWADGLTRPGWDKAVTGLIDDEETCALLYRTWLRDDMNTLNQCRLHWFAQQAGLSPGEPASQKPGTWLAASLFRRVPSGAGLKDQVPPL